MIKIDANMKQLMISRGKLRLLNNLCPKCASTDLECTVCRGYNHTRKVFPIGDDIKGEWSVTHLEELNQMLADVHSGSNAKYEDRQ